MLAFVSGVQYFHCAFEVTDARGKVHHLEMPDLVARLGGAAREMRVAEMCGEPEQLRQFAAILAAEFGPNASVFAEDWVSVNGPPYTRLVEPGLDLAGGGGQLMMAPYPWLRARNEQYRTADWRATFRTIRQEWHATGFDMVGPLELLAGENKTHGITMPTAPVGSGAGAGLAANWYSTCTRVNNTQQ